MFGAKGETDKGMEVGECMMRTLGSLKWFSVAGRNVGFWGWCDLRLEGIEARLWRAFYGGGEV